MTYGLSDIHLKAITDVLAGNNRIEQVILFGSRAKGTHRPGSDVDMALKGRDLTHNDLVDVSNALDELWLPIRFDLILYDRVKEPALLDQINQFGKDLLLKPSLV
ncbi:nucleotidyltransferase family protein [Larkinella punicea]|uniref:Nucleotidyltransferase domain-containing protein n=1 Tax=Larkinella punicea TaxID=2315727 RepID=A0A368JSD8_9BACT|nr:nucleotidyltransferase domain-containing protein [Larkinella punicea]RCR70580.1 nucleotidyltransferase domain-containing protein [Larkinella punicea]